jgi:hypothetical protein
MQEQNIQTAFFELLKTKIDSNSHLADIIAALLSISKDSAYRRIRGDTPLSLDETILICKKLNIDLSQLVQSASNDLVVFKYNQLFTEKGGFLDYIKNMTKVLQMVASKNGKIYYAAEDIPIFHHFQKPYLASFKLYYWNKTILNQDILVGNKLEFELMHPDLLAAAEELLKAYESVTSHEIWTEESINSTLRQMEYFAESGQFQRKEQALKVIEEFKEMFENLQKMAETSSKNESDRNFQMYNSEVLIGNNCILIEIQDQKYVFLSHNTFNSLSTQNESFCHETELWMNNLIKKSTLISDVSEKHRYKFFKKMNDAIQQTKEKFENMEW